MISVRVVECVHDAICHAFGASSVELVGPIVQVEQETHKVCTDPEFIVATASVAHPAQKSGIETSKFAALLFVEVGQVDHPGIGFLRDSFRQRINMHSERNGCYEIRKLDHSLSLLRFGHGREDGLRFGHCEKEMRVS